MKQINFVKPLWRNEKKCTNDFIMRSCYLISAGEKGRKYYNTYKNKSYNTNNMYHTNPPSYMNPNFGNSNDMTTNMNMGHNENTTLLNQHYLKYDPNNNSFNSFNSPNNPNSPTNIPNNNSTSSNYFSPGNKYNFQQTLNNSPSISYQYFSIFGSTAMCLIKPVFPDQILNKNKITIFGKGGFQFMFMKKQMNTNKYDKNNKMSIFVKINHLSNILFLTDVENLKNPLTLKGTGNNYLIIDKHKEKKDHLIVKYKYQPLDNTTTTTATTTTHATTTTTVENNNSNSNYISVEMDNTPNLTIDINDNINEPIEEPKKNTYQELYVTFPFSEFLIFQKAANLLLPYLLGWAKQS